MIGYRCQSTTIKFFKKKPFTFQPGLVLQEFVYLLGNLFNLATLCMIYHWLTSEWFELTEIYVFMSVFDFLSVFIGMCDC